MTAVTHLLGAQAAAQRLAPADDAQAVVQAVLLYRLAQALAALGHHPARGPAGPRRHASARSAGVAAQ